MEAQTAWEALAELMDRLVDTGFVLLGGPLADEQRVVLVVEAQSTEAVRARLGEDPWSGSHLVVASVEPWTIRLGGRKRATELDPPRSAGCDSSSNAWSPRAGSPSGPARVLGRHGDNVGSRLGCKRRHEVLNR
jgi:hypothetical protein